MERLVAKYADKLVEAGLAESGAPLLGGLDAELVWNRPDPLSRLFDEVFAALNINSLLYCRPREPYASIIDYLAAHSDGVICPRDSETRTFLHDLPVAAKLSSAAVAKAFMSRKCVIVPGGGIATFGTVSPEQTFVVFSSVCFACYVKFHVDYLHAFRLGKVDPQARRIIEMSLSSSEPSAAKKDVPPTGPYLEEEQVHHAMVQTGRFMVEHRLVDSFFGNISYLAGDTLYISQTGSSLDELEGCIDPCPVDGSLSTGITASSELTAHLRIVKETDHRSILHGHPKFPVILSLDCDETDCALDGQCHIRCPKERFIADIPVVPGEVGTGSHGLCHTLPPAINGRRGVIVYGHGLFTTGKSDFIEPFANMKAIEEECKKEFLARTGF
jgi:ribulose-5-phosphate 4-epimerase/fuculose-1-phosphate aldolase